MLAWEATTRLRATARYLRSRRRLTRPQSSHRSAQTLTHLPWPYGVAKNPLRRSRRATSVSLSLNAIDGCPLIHSNGTNVRLPARKFGWPQEPTSLVSGSERQSLRIRWRTGSSFFIRRGSRNATKALSRDTLHPVRRSILLRLLEFAQRQNPFAISPVGLRL